MYNLFPSCTNDACAPDNELRSLTYVGAKCPCCSSLMDVANKNVSKTDVDDVIDGMLSECGLQVTVVIPPCSCPKKQ